MSLPISIRGNLGKDPEIKFYKDKPFVSFSLAYTPRVYTDGKWVEGETMWFNVTQWGEKSEVLMDTLKKGDTVLIIGEWKQRLYETDGGEKRSSLEIKAENVGKVARAEFKKPTTEQEDQPSW